MRDIFLYFHLTCTAIVWAGIKAHAQGVRPLFGSEGEAARDTGDEVTCDQTSLLLFFVAEKAEGTPDSRLETRLYSFLEPALPLNSDQSLKKRPTRKGSVSEPAIHKII